MRPLLTLLALFWAAPLAAHPGHLTGLAGNDHWVAGAAIGLAVVIGVLGAMKGRKDAGGEPTEDENAEAAEA